MINYNNKIFITKSNSENGDTNLETIYYYKQIGNTVTANYEGGFIKSGFLEATTDKKGNLQMRYYHTNINNELVTGVCTSTPEILPNGKIRLVENWQWTCKNFAKGISVLEEVDGESVKMNKFIRGKVNTYSN